MATPYFIEFISKFIGIINSLPIHNLLLYIGLLVAMYLLGSMCASSFKITWRYKNSVVGRPVRGT